MKENLKTFFYGGILFGTIMAVFFSLLNGFYFGILGGIISGILFGLMISIFSNIQKRKFKKITSKVIGNKNVIMEGAANHFKGAEGVGGWLYLTPDELVFKSHAFNVHTHETFIPLNQIIEVKAVLTAGFIPNGLQIKTIDGAIEIFVVNNRKAWINAIKKMGTVQSISTFQS